MKTIINRLNKSALNDVRNIAKGEPKASILLPKQSTIAASAIRYLETGNTFAWAKCYSWYKQQVGIELPKIMEMPIKYVGDTDIGYWDGFLVRVITAKN